MQEVVGHFRPWQQWKASTKSVQETWCLYRSKSCWIVLAIAVAQVGGWRTPTCPSQAEAAFPWQPTHYPYKGKQTNCQTSNLGHPKVSIEGYQKVQPQNERQLKVAVARQPVSVGIDGANLDFQFYYEGVLDGKCGTHMKHAVTIIGYGRSKQKKYWLVKNSWGIEWGEKGYMRIARGVRDRKGKCGIAVRPSYPIM